MGISTSHEPWPTVEAFSWAMNHDSLPYFSVNWSRSYYVLLLRWIPSGLNSLISVNFFIYYIFSIENFPAQYYYVDISIDFNGMGHWCNLLSLSINGNSHVRWLKKYNDRVTVQVWRDTNTPKNIHHKSFRAGLGTITIIVVMTLLTFWSRFDITKVRVMLVNSFSYET